MNILLSSKYVNFECPYFDFKITSHMISLFDNFNQEIFDKEVKCPSNFFNLISLIYDIFKQKKPFFIDKGSIKKIENISKDDKNILLAFSSGLDSAFQAISLRDKGYNVHLFFVKNLNSYEGSMSYNCAKEFSEKTGMELICANVKKHTKYKPYWEDNAIKNQLLQSMMIDICIEKGWNNISLGDDASMSINRPDCTLGINITDCKEVQEEFTKIINGIYPNINILLIERKYGSIELNKYDRLMLLKNNGLIDTYYSCVGAGRFNQYNHELNDKKYKLNGKLPKYNCGCSCAKCALHNLLLHYKNEILYPKDFIDKCWERLWNTKHGSIIELFGKDIPLEKRIENLYKY